MAQPETSTSVLMRVACQCGHVFWTERTNVACPACRVRGKTISWPTAEQLERVGFTRCQHDGGCSVYVDPLNVKDPRRPDAKLMCANHARALLREQRKQRSRSGGRRQSKVPYIPRDGRAARIAERDSGRVTPARGGRR